MSNFEEIADSCWEDAERQVNIYESDREEKVRHEFARRLVAALGAQEILWLPVVGFEDKYEVSSIGDLRNKTTQKILSKNITGCGYIKADLWNANEKTQTSMHRVVARAFLGAPKDGHEVNHKNGIKTDNRVENLEWCSKSDNVNHAYYVLGHSVSPVVATNVKTGEKIKYPSIEAAVRDGFRSGSIYRCLSGEYMQTDGFSFERESAPVLPSVPEGWKSIETAPKDGAYVAILFRPYANKENQLYGGCATYINGEFIDDEGDPMHTPEYWKLLPAPPSPQEDAP